MPYCSEVRRLSIGILGLIAVLEVFFLLTLSEFAPSIQPEIHELKDAVDEHLRRVQSQQCGAIFLVWTTAAQTFGARQRATLRSLLRQHPCAKITVYSNTLSDERVSVVSSSIAVARFSLESLRVLARDAPGAQLWLERYTEWQSGPYFFSHLTDFLRYALLYSYGGTYSDFDALYLRSS